MDFRVGSSVFFSKFPDYTSKDEDWLALQDHWLPNKIHVLNIKQDGKDIFFWSPLTKEEFIKDTLTCNVPMRAGKFLVPEFAKYIGMTIDDLKRLDKCFESMDDKHSYEKIIYKYYLENQDFILTDDQLKEVYNTYKCQHI